MAVTVTHPFVSAVADGADATVVRPSNWNATHSISGTLDVVNGGTGVTTSTGTGSTVLSASPTFTGTLGAAAITASTTLGVTGIASIGPNPIAVSGAAIDVGNNRNSPTRVGVSNQNSGASATAGIVLEAAGGGWKIDVPADTATFVNPLIFSFNTTERMRISGSGLMTVGGGAVIQGLTVGKGAGAIATNTAVGVSALPVNSSGILNSAIGMQSLYLNQDGFNNTGLGTNAGYSNVSGSYNVAIGDNSGFLNTGNSNIFIGSSAATALTTGNNNTIIGTNLAGTAGLSNTVIIAAGSAERMRINSVGTVIVNQGTSVGTYGGQIPIMELYQTSISSTDADGGTQVLFGSSAFAIDKGAATTYGFKYNTAGNYATTARVRGAKENATDGNLAGYLAFDTRANGGNLTEKVRIDSTGNVIVATAAKGINFTANTPAAGKTSQLLNWYEEGTFTPAVIGSTTAGTATYTRQAGRYTRIGRLVTFQIDLAWTSGTGVGNLQFSGLPFTSATGINTAITCAFINSITLTALNYFQSYLTGGSSVIDAMQSAVGGSSISAVPYDVGADVMLSGSYIV